MDLAGATEAARRGLKGSPWDQRLCGDLMLAAVVTRDVPVIARQKAGQQRLSATVLQTRERPPHLV